MPETDSTDKSSPNLANQAEASRGTDDGSKIQKKTISFSKGKPGNSSNFFSPEEIENSEPNSGSPDIAAQSNTGHSQAISMNTARPGNSSKAPLTPPGGGLTPPGGGLTPPGGGLTPPGGGLTPPGGAPTPAPEAEEEDAANLITDPNLKPKPKLQLRTK